MSRTGSCSRANLRASIFALALAGLLASVAQQASAQTPVPLPPGIDPIDIPPEHDPLAHAWDRPGDRGGFYLRAAMALGYNATRLGPAPWANDDYLGATAGGFGTGFTLDLGWCLAPWVALHLDGHIGVLWNGDLDRDFSVYYDYTETRTAAYGGGPAVTFFTPHDFYFTGAFGVGIAHTKYAGYKNTTNPGFYMNWVAGKDLYVGRHFSFGFQFQIVYMLLKDENVRDEARVREFLFGTSFAFDSM